MAAIAHGEEAFLAAVFLFTVHFFNNHFRPDKFPLDIVMFTGTMSLEHFARDHGVQYRRLLESGELAKLLVDAPTPAMTLRSRSWRGADRVWFELADASHHRVLPIVRRLITIRIVMAPPNNSDQRHQSPSNTSPQPTTGLMSRRKPSSVLNANGWLI